MSTDPTIWASPLAVAAVLPLALLVDRLQGEPRSALHPVVWMGTLLAALGRWLPSSPPRGAFAAGAAAWCLGAGVSVSGALLVERLLYGWLRWGVSTMLGADAIPEAAIGGTAILAWTLLTAWLLKPLLALRSLLEEVGAVEHALGLSLAAGRERTARICSRDTAALEATALRETAIESLAENLNDSLVAPLFWFAVAGLPGAALYRWANTADAMWGYRDPRREWSGKFAARADDVLSWPPARLTALLLSPRGQGRRLREEAGRTPSPNGGWPMAAMALRLGVRLGKPGAYTLNEPGRPADGAALRLGLASAHRTGWIAAAALGVLAAVVLWTRSALWTGALA